MADTEFKYDDLPPLVAKGADRALIIAELVKKWCAEPTEDDEPSGHFLPAYTLEYVALVDANLGESAQAIDLRELIIKVQTELDKRNLSEDEKSKRIIAFYHCRIDSCNCANLEIIPGIQVFDCRFGEGADFVSAKFGEGADFRSAKFGEGLDLSNTVLDRADLRHTKGLLFNETRIKDVQIEGKAPDPWSRLRRQYTGPWFFVHLLLLIAFFTPFAAKALALTAAANMQEAAEQFAIHLPANRQLEFQEAKDRYKETRREVPVLLVLSGGHKGLFFLGMTSLVIFYNFLRIVLTLQINRLRDAEDRSSVTPLLEEYYGVCHPRSKSGHALHDVLLTWWSNWKSRKGLPLFLLNRLPDRLTPSLPKDFKPHSFFQCVGLYRLHRFASTIIWISIIFTALNVIIWALETRIWI